MSRTTAAISDVIARGGAAGLRLNRGPRLSREPFSRPDALVPHTSRRGYAWSHNGIMIPGLPDPLRFLSVTTFAGTPGAVVSDS